MSLQALEEVLKAEIGIAAQDQAIGTVNGSGIDTRNFDEALIIVNVGDATTGTADIKVQQSSDDGAGDAYTDIAGAAFTQIDTNNDQTVYVARLRVKNFERYIRIVSVVATAAIELSVDVILGKFDGLSKVTQVNTTEFALDYVSDGGKEGSPAT